MKFIYFLLGFLILLLNFSLISCNSKPWCWTKPVKSDKAVFDSKTGGENWGYCQNQQKVAKTIYTIGIETPNIDGSASADSFFITLFGDEGKSTELLITNAGLAAGTFITKVASKNIGDLTKIKLRTTSQTGYRCNQIRVELGHRFWDFDCNNFLACPKLCSEDLFLSGNQHYSVSIKTSSQADSGTTAPIYIEFIGLLGRSPKKILSEQGLQLGNSDDLEIRTMDVGTVYGVVLSMTKSDNYRPEEIIVKRSGKETSKYLAKGQSISCPLQCSISLMNPKPGDEVAAAESPKESGTESDNEEEGASSSAEDNSKSSAGNEGPDSSSGGSSGSGSGSASDLDNSYVGAGLSPGESNKILQLTCETKIKDNSDFGPIYSKNNVNHQSFLVICPKDCWKAGVTPVLGVGIHPEESSICRSAIVDRSMPLLGGLIGVSIQDGINSYDGGINVNGLEIKEYKSSFKSFHTYKVDNPDFMSSDLRLVDSNGNPSFSGRLEFRLNGVWGTVCAKKMRASAAKRICQQLKFADGDLKNPVDESSSENGGFCKYYKGEDFCGPTPMPIHYMAMNCDGSTGDIMKCYREIAEKSQCTHENDAIIECTNTNYDLTQDPLPGTVRVIDDTGSPSMDGSGRLEFFMGGKWGTVCNNKFTDKAAHVACRQMGFLTGKLIGNEGESGVCLRYKGKNHCASTNSQINLNEVNCQGSEAKVKMCGGTSVTTNCNHEQDIIVKCDGTSGDTSGKSQSPTAALATPQYGKLALLPIITATCKTKMTEAIFRGDPGSIYLVNCPKDCSENGGIVWGTSIYTVDSSICRAAIHAGVLRNTGGLVEIVKRPGLKQYSSTTIRGIRSTTWGSWPASFTLTNPNTLAIKLSQKIKGSSKSLLQLQSSSELKIAETPIFKWFPPVASFEFNGKDTNVKTQGEPGIEKTSQLSGFSIAISIVMSRSPKTIQTLVSHSSCGGYALIISEIDELVFKSRCSDQGFNSGYFVPLNVPLSIVISYDTKNAEFWVNEKMVNKKAISFMFKCQGNLDIGKYGDNIEEVFNGKINYVQIYETPLSKNAVISLYTNGIMPPKKGKDLKNVFTIDNRLCLTKCTTNPLPGTPGAGNPPAEAECNKGDYSSVGPVKEGMGDAEENLSSGGNGSGEESNIPPEEQKSKEAEKQQEEISQQASTEMKCDLSADDPRFLGPSGKVFRVTCPKNCAHHPEGNVFGTLIYSDDSSVCKAAIHAGFLKDAEGGEFLVEIANGLPNYEASLKNGIASAQRAANARSVTFKEAPPLTAVSCEENAASPRFAGVVGTKFTVNCNAECSKKEHKVFGTGPFTDDSSICQAGLLIGALTDKGGEVQFVIAEGQSSYKGGFINGIKAGSKDNYIRSFNILGKSSTTCHYFKEKYSNTNILSKWKIVNAKGVSNTGSGIWSYASNPTGYGLSVKQSSGILGSDYNYGTSLIYTDFECGEGVYYVNVYMEHERQGAILFRYSDDNNYYSVEFNQPGEKKLRLVKKLQGTGSILRDKSLIIQAKNWYRFKISFHNDNLQVWLQKGLYRNIDLIFNVTDSDIQRGTIGLASNGNSEIYFDGIDVHEFNSKYGVFDKSTKEMRIWDGCLNGGEEGSRKKYCKNVYGSYTEGKRKCQELHNYCEICCDRTIPKLENIINYGCYKDCIKNAKDSKKKEANEFSSLVDDSKWVPQINGKVDFKSISLGDKSYFVPAVISRADKIKKEKSKLPNDTEPQKYKITLSFSIDNQPKNEEIVWPNENVKKCGEALPGRIDC